MSVLQNIRFLRAFDKFTASVGKDGSTMNWLMSLISLGTAAATIFAPQIQHVVSAHPSIATVVAAIFAIFAHIAPSPTGAAITTPKV